MNEQKKASRLKKILGNKNHLGRRYVIFLLGLFICSFGVACTTKAGLGTSPVAAIPYSLALIFPRFSFGNWLIIFCMIQIAIQIILLKKNCIASEILIQVILAFVYGYLTDFSVFLLNGLVLKTYLLKAIFLLVGCIILAFGVYLELVGDVGMLSNDAFVKVIAQVTNKQYAPVKTTIDISMTVIAGIVCFLFLGKLEGVREGTIFAAFCVGPIIKQFQKLFRKQVSVILPE